MSKENKKLTQAFIPQLRKRDVDCYLTAQIPRLKKEIKFSFCLVGCES